MLPQNITLTQVTLSDLKTLQQISKETFVETFAALNTKENMQKYLDEALSLEKLSAELISPHVLFYFACLGDKIIGYLKLNFGGAQTELHDDRAMEIERIYVLKEFHGKKVAQLLFEKSLQEARSRNMNYIWLGVWEKNERAINFYKKTGFYEFDKHIFKLGNEEQTDIMMKLDLPLA